MSIPSRATQNPKATHYQAQLQKALVAGKWTSKTPSQAPNGSPQSWNELLHKYGKHCDRNHDVVSQNQNIALLLSRGRLTPASCDADSDLLAVGEECVLPQERVADGEKGYEALKTLRLNDAARTFLSESSSPSDIGQFLTTSLGQFAFSLNRPEDCLAHLEQLPEIQSSRQSTSSSSASGKAVAPFTDTDLADGKVWVLADHIKAICLRGMSYELIAPENARQAIDAYSIAIPSLLEMRVSRVPPTASGASNWDSFERYRELWRWIERLLWRAIILSASDPNASESMWSFFQIYMMHSLHWSPTFRPQHRSTVYRLHLRALVVYTPEGWLSTAKTIIGEFRAVLSETTQFPRAGERNGQVEDFLDLCMAAWEASGAVGEHAGWVIDIMWWATRLTFNCPRLYRHLSRLLWTSNDPKLAVRCLRLYKQVVSKAREAGTEGTHPETDAHWVETLVDGSLMICRGAKSTEEVSEAGALIHSARERVPEKDERLLAMVDRAEGIWNLVLMHQDDDSSLRLVRLKNSITNLMRSLEADPECASTEHHLALALARPGPTLDLNSAVVHARRAVELSPKTIRHWHLLGILLSATGDWRGAMAVLEYGVAIDIQPPDESAPGLDAVPEASGIQVTDFANDDTGADQLNGVSQINSSMAPRQHILERGASAVPESATLLSLPLAHPPSSRRERFEHAVQIRLTQLALVERVEGGENVGERFFEVFQWFAAQIDTRKDGGWCFVNLSDDDCLSLSLFEGGSVAGHEPIEPPPQPDVSEKMDERQSLDINLEEKEIRISRSSDSLEVPPPIQLTPATPMDYQQNEIPLVRQESATEVFALRPGNPQRVGSARNKVKKLVHKGQKQLSRRIGRQASRTESSLRLARTNSAPDFHTVMSQSRNYLHQASSIHSRKRLPSWGNAMKSRHLAATPPLIAETSPKFAPGTRSKRERRLLSDIWLASAASFRRLGKTEHSHGAIQEAELLDPDSERVWVQLGLYYTSVSKSSKAVEAFNKALFISMDDVPATVHLCAEYLQSNNGSPDNATLDLAVGTLAMITRGHAWDVPEAWYLRAKAARRQGDLTAEREFLSVALPLVKCRGVREIGSALGWIL